MSTKSAKKSSSGGAAAYRCTECGWTTAKWVGRCGECQQWNTVVEAGVSAEAAAGPRTSAVTLTGTEVSLPITEVDASFAAHQSTGVPEFDRVLGGGVIPGGVVLLAGPPGIGKSTLVLEVATQYSRLRQTDGEPRRVLYITGEESAAQVRMRADRIGAISETLYLASETDLGRALGQVEAVDPQMVIVDSVQTLQSGEVEGTAGGVNQIREVASSFIRAAKQRNIATIIVGHVTKDGSIAGPRTLEHLVDVVCQFEGDRHARLRMVRAVKNRYGSTDEVGCFDLDDHGITSVSDPSGLFASSLHKPVPGTAMTVTLEGQRPLLTEVQALVTRPGRSTDGSAKENNANGRRTVSGLESSRTNMLIAVLEQTMRISLRPRDVYVSTVGGIRITEPASDLAVAAALYGSIEGKAVARGTIGFGELGLTGELRAVPGTQRRINEAARLGFRRAVVPRIIGDKPLDQPEDNFEIVPVNNLRDALDVLFDNERDRRRPHLTQVNR